MDKILEFFGEETYQNRLQRVRDFWGGQGRVIVSVNTAHEMYRQSFDEDTILQKAPANLEAQAEPPGVNLPTFFADFGTVSTAKHWGGKTRFDSTGDNIFIDPVAANIEEALDIRPLAPSDPSMDGPLAIKLFNSLCEVLETDNLWLRTPDMQGPLNTAGLVLNQEELLMGMYTQPDLITEFLEKVTDLLIDYARYFNEQSGNKVCGFIWPYTFFPCDLGLALTEDMMPLLPAELYQQFGLPCLENLSETFGSVLIHCCGQWGHHAATLGSSSAEVAAAEFHYPFTTIEELECLAENSVFVPYISLDKQDQFNSVSEYYAYLLDSTGENYRFWFAWPEDTEEAVEFAETFDF